MNPTNKMRPIRPGEVLREELLAPLGVNAHARELLTDVQTSLKQLENGQGIAHEDAKEKVWKNRRHGFGGIGKSC